MNKSITCYSKIPDITIIVFKKIHAHYVFVLKERITIKYEQQINNVQTVLTNNIQTKNTMN